MKVLVTGANGQLGYDILKVLNQNNINCLGVDKDDFDITNEVKTYEYISKYNPNVLIHCAGYTNVDKAEVEKQLCFDINVLGTKNIAKACSKINAKLVYISTDYVFDGKSEKPYDVDDLPNPINHYGQCKYEGELEVIRIIKKHYILRTSWLFGVNGNNFVKTMINLAKTNNEISVVNDQFGSPTYTYDLAKVILKIIKTNKYGIYHVTNEGYCSWYEFALEIFKYFDVNVNVKAIKSKEYISKTLRPKNSRLSKAYLKEQGLSELNNWEKALQEFIQILNSKRIS